MASPGPSSLGAVSEDRRCLDPQPVSRRACRLRRTLRAPRLIALMSSSSAGCQAGDRACGLWRDKRRRVARALGLATLCSLALGACGSAPLSAGAGRVLTAAAMGGAIDGGTAYFAEQPELPLITSSPSSQVSTSPSRTQLTSRPFSMSRSTGSVTKRALRSTTGSRSATPLFTATATGR